MAAALICTDVHKPSLCSFPRVCWWGRAISMNPDATALLTERVVTVEQSDLVQPTTAARKGDVVSWVGLLLRKQTALYACFTMKWRADQRKIQSVRSNEWKLRNNQIADVVSWRKGQKVHTGMGGTETAMLKGRSFPVSLILLSSYPFPSLSRSPLHWDVNFQAQKLTLF